MTEPSESPTQNNYTVRIGAKLRNIQGACAADALATLSPEDRAVACLITDDTDLIFEPRTCVTGAPNPRLVAAWRSKSRFRWFSIAAIFTVRIWPIWPIALALVLAMFYSPTRGIATLGALMLGILVAWIVRRIVSYQRWTAAINRAVARQDWHGILTIADALSLSLAVQPRATFERSVAQFRIRALVMLNRRQVATALIERHAADPQSRPELVLYLRAVNHRICNDLTAELEAYREMTIACPHSTFGWLTYAEKLALDHARPQDARAALDQARTLPIAHGKQWQLHAIEGFVRLSEGRDQDAIESLAAARAASPDAFTLKAARSSVASGELAACMAIAHARLGHVADANRELNLTFATLSHHQHRDLIERAQREVGACEQRAANRGV